MLGDTLRCPLPFAHQQVFASTGTDISADAKTSWQLFPIVLLKRFMNIARLIVQPMLRLKSRQAPFLKGCPLFSKCVKEADGIVYSRMPLQPITHAGAVTMHYRKRAASMQDKKMPEGYNRSSSCLSIPALVRPHIGHLIILIAAQSVNASIRLLATRPLALQIPLTILLQRWVNCLPSISIVEGRHALEWDNRYPKN